MSFIFLAGIAYFLQINNKGTITSATVISSDKIDDSNVKSFVLTEKNFRFVLNNTENPDLYVKLGEKVIIEIINIENFHILTIEEFRYKRRINENGSTIEFIADKKGIFEYHCALKSHTDKGMKGRLIVE